jgi:hypothetical protein
MKKETKSIQKPFFAHFLEDQDLSGPEKDAVQGGATLKYPSDREDNTSRTADDTGGGYVTLKVPSDSDEAGDIK